MHFRPLCTTIQLEIKHYTAAHYRKKMQPQQKWTQLRAELYLLSRVEGGSSILSDFWILARFSMKGLMVGQRAFCLLLWMSLQSMHGPH